MFCSLDSWSKGSRKEFWFADFGPLCRILYFCGQSVVSRIMTDGNKTRETLVAAWSSEFVLLKVSVIWLWKLVGTFLKFLYVREALKLSYIDLKNEAIEKSVTLSIPGFFSISEAKRGGGEGRVREGVPRYNSVSNGAVTINLGGWITRLKNGN